MNNFEKFLVTNGITVQELVSASGISQTQVYNLINGTIPRITTMRKLASGLGIEYAEVLKMFGLGTE